MGEYSLKGRGWMRKKEAEAQCKENSQSLSNNQQKIIKERRKREELLVVRQRKG
jgi:hypothetical protein